MIVFMVLGPFPCERYATSNLRVPPRSHEAYQPNSPTARSNSTYRGKLRKRWPSRFVPGWLVVSSRLLGTLQVGDEFTLRQCRRRRTDRASRLLARFGIVLYAGEEAGSLTVRAIHLPD